MKMSITPIPNRGDCANRHRLPQNIPLNPQDCPDKGRGGEGKDEPGEQDCRRGLIETERASHYGKPSASKCLFNAA